MKTFIEFLNESVKNYQFRIKVAGTLSNDQIDKMELCLDKWGLLSLTKPKVTPIQKHPQDFPNIKDSEVSIVEVVLEYPATPAELIARISEYCGCVSDRIRVYNEGDPVEAEREEAVEKENEEYEVQLTAPYPKGDSDHQYGDKFVKNFLKVQKRKPSFKVAGGKTPAADTTNDLTQGTTSPIGSMKRPK